MVTADTQYQNAVPGFYVVNDQTAIAVARCDTERAARREAKRRNDRWWHVDPNPLIVTVVHDCWEPGTVPTEEADNG